MCSRLPQQLKALLGLLLVVGFMGAQSALFGPSKYGILKEMLDERDMSRANALIQTTTTVAILGGFVVAGELLDRFPDRLWLPGLSCVAIAAAGLIASLAIRHEPARVPEREIPWNLPKEFARHWRALRGHPTLAISIAGSAFYYFVAALLVCIVSFAIALHWVVTGPNSVAELERDHMANVDDHGLVLVHGAAWLSEAWLATRWLFASSGLGWSGRRQDDLALR